MQTHFEACLCCSSLRRRTKKEESRCRIDTEQCHLLYGQTLKAIHTYTTDRTSERKKRSDQSV